MTGLRVSSERVRNLRFVRLATPLVCQYFTAPLYLLGLAFYNLPDGTLGAQLASVQAAQVAPLEADAPGVGVDHL